MKTKTTIEETIAKFLRDHFGWIEDTGEEDFGLLTDELIKKLEKAGFLK